MSHVALPVQSSDVLNVPVNDVPEVLRSLLNRRGLSALMQQIHADLQSESEALRQTARAALAHLGFAE
ncbi:MAG: hypothetical protein N4A70_02570 [Pelagimonas sp.]|jgi:hypothetical protein|nr:hypothetical protein [Pelagimonas sp.]